MDWAAGVFFPDVEDPGEGLGVEEDGIKCSLMAMRNLKHLSAIRAEMASKQLER